MENSQKSINTHNKKLPTLRVYTGAQRKSRKSSKVKRIMKRQTVIETDTVRSHYSGRRAGIILFMLAIWYRGKNSEPVTDEQVAAQMQQAEPLVIETPGGSHRGQYKSIRL